MDDELPEGGGDIVDTIASDEEDVVALLATGDKIGDIGENGENGTGEPPRKRQRVSEVTESPRRALDQPEIEDAAGVVGDGELPTSRGPSSSTPNTPKSRRKPEKQKVSPPWKKMAAEGPTSFLLDGKRKSGRTNQLPLEQQPERRTRAAGQITSFATNKHGALNGSPASARQVSTSTPLNYGTRKAGSAAHLSSQSSKSPATLPPKRSHKKKVPLPAPVQMAVALSPVLPKRSHKKKVTEVETASKRSHKKRVPVQVSDEEDPTPSAGSSQYVAAQNTYSRGRRSGLRYGESGGWNRKAEQTRDGSPRMKTPPRIRLRPPGVLPVHHPDLIQPKTKYPSIREFLLLAKDIPVEQGGLMGPDDERNYTPEDIARDAQYIVRLEDAAEDGGPLCPGLCSAYQPEAQAPVPLQYSQWDHLNRAAIGFRKLMIAERKKHQSTAKRVAELCKEEWYRRQPKTSEQLEADKREIAVGRYKSVLKSFQATWENVRAEVNRKRVLEWEAQEQARVRMALNEAVDISTQKLQAQRAQAEVSTDEEHGSGLDDSSASESEDRDSNMSASESEADEDPQTLDAIEDEHLTVEQLRDKYASVPSPSRSVTIEDLGVVDAEHEQSGPEKGFEDSGTDEDMEDSDESIDMDDDMGSSDEGLDSDEEDERGSDASEAPGTSTLLGFLAPSDLQSIGVTADMPILDMIDEDDEYEERETSVVPNIAEFQPTPKEPNRGAREDAESHAPQPCNKSVTDPTAASPENSNHPSPETSGTKPSETDSASSVELHQDSRQATPAASPSTTNLLKTPVPSLLRGTLREYQHYGLDWLAGLYDNNTNGILADEMGLGKTIQTIALLAHLACQQEVWGPHLVIVPTSVIMNWEMEFKKWCPGFKIMTYYGSIAERAKKRNGWKTDDTWNVCITSYQIVLSDQAVFKRRRWHYMILDEAHNIKNFQSQRWQTMLTFNTRARLLLTGTPLQNNLTELWSLLYFLMPGESNVGGFANLREFQDWFKKPSEQILEHGREEMDDESRAIISKLHKVLRPYLLRRLKADVEKQMPKKYEHVEYCRLSKRQRELYDGFLSRGDIRDTLASGNYLSIINCLMQLRKVCNHPDLFLDRPIMTSFPMERSAVADFEIKDLMVRRRLLREDPMTRVSLDFLNMVPTKHESISGITSQRISVLNAHRLLMDMREAQRIRAKNSFTTLDPSTVKSNLLYLESASRWSRFEELQHCVYLNALRKQQTPIYGSRLIEMLTLGINERPLQPKPRQRNQMMRWLEETSPTFTAMIPTLQSRSQALNATIRTFACVTPRVIARDLTPLTLGVKGAQALHNANDGSTPDPFHEARMRLTIQFPDKRLLQYDCGKLQSLAKLLRRLQAGGHRALIFTQMTKVLDILERFLNIHNHKYLRLDGSTKVEDRQILCDRFNNDTRILAFILSSRSGGLGLNLTGADTVIFYDLDWNPAMDKQCQDRAHRIGQTREVNIYRLVSEHTIEANILKKANQKQMLDDVVIQEGEFTTDYSEKIVPDASEEDSDLLDGDAAANAAMDRVLGGPEKNTKKIIAQAEDREDVIAATTAEREIVQTDADDFNETTAATAVASGTPLEGASTPVIDRALEEAEPMDIDEDDELNAWGVPVKSTDDYMLRFMHEQLKDQPVDLPRDKGRSKKGKDHRSHRSHRAR